MWTEIYSESKQRWVHCDPAEEAFDQVRLCYKSVIIMASWAHMLDGQPMLYTVGWGKKLTYCIGFSCEEAVDVTKRYTQNWPEVLERRTLVDEDVLAKV